MRSWVSLYPERLTYELRLLAEAGFAPDDEVLRQQARLVASGVIEHNGERVDLTIVYPDSFPFVRPEVFAPGLRLVRHQNPFQHNLCLLDRSTRAWNTSDTGAWLLTERVPELLRLVAEGGPRLEQNEVPQGEPITAYFRPEPGTVVFVPEVMTALPADCRSGTLELAAPNQEPATLRLRALVLRASTKDHKRRVTRLGAAESDLLACFEGPAIKARWVRLDAAPGAVSADSLEQAIRAVEPKATEPQWHKVRGGQVSVVGAVLREEVRRGQYQDAWLFLVRFRRLGPSGTEEGRYITRGERISRRSLSERIPLEQPLADKTVALLGLGALGAPLALELARAGVSRLRVLDGESVEVGNTVRWPVGLTAVGHSKVDVVDGWIKANYPFTSVTGYRGRLGAVPSPQEMSGVAAQQSDFAVLEELLDGADLVIDATAEIGIQHMLSSVATPEVPQLFVWATEGAWGGVVAAVKPPASGCWMCLQHRLEDGSIPLPPRDLGEGIQPAGCASLTFTGTAYNLAPVSAQAARVASSILRTGKVEAPHVSLCAMRDSRGEDLPVPDWTTAALTAHPKCDRCSPAAAAAA